MPTRRQIMTGALGAGFALAVRPVSAQTIITSGDGLEAGDVKIPTAGGVVAAYRAAPRRPKRKPAVVLVVHEIFGVHEHIRDVCRRLAKLGYFAIAPDLFARQGDVSNISDTKQIFAQVVSKVPDAQVLADLDATCAWAKATGAADVGRLAITGFCWGGRVVWLYAAHAPALTAGVAWYGRLVGDKDALHPRQPIDVAASLAAPVLGLYGGEDQSIPQATVEQMTKALAAAAGKPSQRSRIQVYPHAGHAFFADYRPSYRADAAADGWSRMLAWLKTNGVG